MGVFLTDARKSPLGGVGTLGLPPAHPYVHRNASFENESWLEADVLATVLAGTLLIKCPECF